MSGPASPLTMAYYPGCSQAGTAIEYDRSARACCAALGVTLVDVPDWTCCGSTPAHTVDHTLAGALAARNLLQAELAGFDRVATPCPSCLAALRTASRHLAENGPPEAGGPSFRAEVERLLDRPAPLRASAVSLLQVLLEDVGIAAIASAVKKPLTGLRVAPYYGCIMNRPPGLMAFDDPENPRALDLLLTACGATVVPFPFKTECCGAAFAMPRLDVMQRLSARILGMAEDCGADCIAVACPLCQMNLDLRRGQVNKAAGRDYAQPVPYFTQLLGLALGQAQADLGLEKLVLDLRPTLKTAGIRAQAARETAEKAEEARQAAKSARAAVLPDGAKPGRPNGKPCPEPGPKEDAPCA